MAENQQLETHFEVMDTRPFHILIVDDDKNFAHTLVDILRSAGYDCHEAHSADDAHNLMGEKIFDLVLSDVKMEGKNGVELFCETRSIQRETPFLFMTAYASNELIIKSLEAGVLAAMQKPLNIPQLVEYIHQLSQQLQAAVVTSNWMPQSQFLKAYSFSRYYYITVFSNIDKLIQSAQSDFRLVLLDATSGPLPSRTEIDCLLDFLSPDSRIIICTGESSRIHLEENDDQRLVVITRKTQHCELIESVLRDEFLGRAKAVARGMDIRHV